MRYNKYQPSESLLLGILLAISGGYWDAYTYILRGGVFANAETGNMVLMGINIAKGDIRQAVSCFLPVLAFALGVLVIGYIRKLFKEIHITHWRNIIIGFETLLIAIVGILPKEGFNHLSTIIVSLVCAMQVAAFKKVRGCPCATTMCTGNLRSFTENIFTYMQSGDRAFLTKAMIYITVIFFFITGAVIGAVCSKLIGIHSIWLTCIILMAVFVLMHRGQINE